MHTHTSKSKDERDTRTQHHLSAKTAALLPATHLRLLVEDDVAALDVAMNDALAVQVYNAPTMVVVTFFVCFFGRGR